MTRRVIMFIIVENWPFNLVLYSFENDLVSCFERIIVIVLCCNLLIRERSSFAVLIRRYSMETEMPDLSHLTPEERRVIENVLMRQRQEEEQERLIVEKKREEMKILEETIQKQRNEMHKKAGSDMEATCHICMKTKFADGIGHICNYCNIRCCARCGGKVTLRSNKVIWVCILCRKKQELLGKTGQWINQRMSSNEPVSKPEQDRDLSVLSDKRAKLERTQSAAEKENQPLERSGSLLRRQYSHQEQSSRSSDSMTRMEKNRSREEEMRQRKEMEARQSTGRHMRRGEISGYKSDSYTSEKSLDRLENPPQRSGSSTVIYPSPSRKHRRSSKGEPPLRKDNQMGIKSQKNLPHQSFSSSDDELKSLSECTSEERDYDKNIHYENSLSRDSDVNLHLISSEISENLRREAKTAFVALAEARRLKKMVRFDGSRQSTKDSGIDMGSSICTSIEDSNSFFKNPLSWKTSPDGKHLVGHMILKKSGWDADGGSSSATMLGLKIVGGKLLENGRRGAIIERVKRGSVADLEGQLKPGDEVLEWNGRSLQQKSYQDVHDIIAESKQEPQVELMVLRKIQPQKSLAKQPYPHRRDSLDRRDKMKPSVMITSPGSPDINTIYRSRNSRFMQGANSSIGGRIQMKLWFDSSTLNLVVTVVCAVGLIPRSNGQPRNTYAKLYLLPDRSEKSKRRTKTLANTNEPRWNQNFIYSSVRRSDLKVKMIEISVWDYMKNSFNDFLGEARIELAIAPLNNEAEWIHLGPHEELVMPRNDFGSYIPSDHLSPPSTTSRLSDSDTSDFDDSNRRVADGASISSLGSSTSPPPDYEKNERRKSRRDTISPQDYNKTSSYKGSLYKHQSLERDVYTKTSYSGYPQRSRSAAPTDTPSLHYRSRSKSPTRVYERSLSPTSHRAQSYGSVYPVPAYGPKMYTTRSATSTPISSPKRRLLPKIPVSVSPALRERIAHDLENRGLYFKNRMRQTRPSGGRFSGWSRHHYSGLSDGDLPHQHRSLSPPSARELGFLCGPKKEGDVEDSYSIDSSTFSTQSEQPQKSRFDDYGARRGSSHQSPSTSGPAMESLERSLSHSDMPSDKNIESSLSDLTLHSLPPSNESQRNKCSPNTSERGSVKSIPGARGSPDSLSSLPKKSNSTSQLSATGRKRRLGFGSSIKSSFTVQRSEEIFPDEVRHLVKQTSSISSDGDGSQDGDSAVALKMAEEEKYQNFIGTLGPGQLVGRQVLGTPPLGEVEVSISTQKGRLEVEVVRVKGLQQNPAFKNLPTPYAKLYLVKGKKCLEKMKTKSSQPTLEPIYQSRFLFKTNPEGCVLQITLWGDYGRLDARKVFMGITQIALSNLDLNKRTIGWYKLFKTCMLVSSGSGPLQISSSL
ncbi:regulating synaptic membrane exocytosis protein 2 isoform X3 [Planococcus citri]|uniref:regulating synaptic membrane exocytosis protein 2 isoform X3 n=1 Tax=Planococcus citri TaxID=170843 RepID=UPI0031FA0CBE